MKPLKAPESVIIAITGRCNLSCTYCYYADEMVALNDLPAETWLSFLEELCSAGVMRVTLSGGEAFIRRDIWELIQGIVQNKMRFSILTNGTLITNTVAARLNKYRRRIDYIQVSIDGSCPETHDLIRGKGSFDKMMMGVSMLKKYELPWTARVTVNKLNVHDLESTLYFLYDKLGLENFGVNESFPRGAGHCNHSSLEMTPEERRLSFKIMQAFDRAHPGAASGAQSGPLIIANMIDKIESARETGKFDASYRTGYLSGCNTMWQEISILHDGTYVPCHQLPQIILGKIGQDPLMDVWHHSDELITLRKRMDIPLESISHCEGCSYQQYCTGGCPGVAYAMTGEMNNINPRDCYRSYIGEDPVYEH